MARASTVSEIMQWARLLRCAQDPAVCVVRSAFPGLLRVCLRPKVGEHKEIEIVFNPAEDCPARLSENVRVLRAQGHSSTRVFTTSAIETLKGVPT